MNNKSLETERLLLRKPKIEDVEPMFNINGAFKTCKTDEFF